MNRTDGWAPNITPEYNLPQFLHVVEMLDWVRLGGKFELTPEKAGEIINEYMHLIREMRVTQADADALRKEIEDLRDDLQVKHYELFQCREALSQFEWIFDYEMGMICPWCHSAEHRPDCPRQAALESGK